jgi:hypothetical protein
LKTAIRCALDRLIPSFLRQIQQQSNALGKKNVRKKSVIPIGTQTGGKPEAVADQRSAVAHLAHASNAGADTTPWELFTGERALVSSMRPFGCLCYPRKIDPITKMSDQSMRCIMLPVITKMSDQSMRCIMLPVTRLRLGSGNLLVLLGAARERLLNA